MLTDVLLQVPSSVNRVYALSRHDHYLFGLTYASSFVLPLQGFWNTVIYIVVSWRSLKMLPYKISHFNPHAIPMILAGRFRGTGRSIIHSRALKTVKGRLGYQQWPLNVKCVFIYDITPMIILMMSTIQHRCLLIPIPLLEQPSPDSYFLSIWPHLEFACHFQIPAPFSLFFCSDR